MFYCIFGIWNDVPSFIPKLQYFLSFLNTTQAKRIINLLLLGNFYPVTSLSTRSARKRRIICSVRLGRSLWSANQLPAQGVNTSDENSMLRSFVVSALTPRYICMMLSASHKRIYLIFVYHDTTYNVWNDGNL